MRLTLGCAVLACAVATSALWLLVSGASSQGLLVNGDFESGTDPWIALGGTLTTAADPLGEDQLGAFTLSLSSGALAQSIVVERGHTYQLSGSYLQASGGVQYVRAELQAFGLGGSSLGPFTMAPLTLPGAWLFDVELPCDTASSANVRIWVTGSPGATVLLDDVDVKSQPPELPCATDTPTPSETPSPVPSDTPSATPTVTLTHTPTSTRTTTPTRTPTSTRTPSSTPDSTTPAPTLTASAPVASPTLTPTLTPSHGLLVNGSFEAGDGLAPVGWRHFGGELLQTTSPVRTGAFAGHLVSASTSTKWVYQTVRVEPDAWYEFLAYVSIEGSSAEAAWLRVSWYANDDASGSAIDTSDSTHTLTEVGIPLTLLTTGSTQAPAAARSANVRVMLRPLSEGDARLTVDDASLLPAAPATPTSTPTLAPTDTPTPPVPTATPSNTRTPTETRTATLTRTPTATRTPTLTRTPSPTRTVTPPSAPSPSEPSVGTPTVALTPASTSTAARSATPPRETNTPASPTPSNGLLLNGGFEAVSDEELLGWDTYGGEVARVDGPVLAGEYAGAFTSNTESTKWLYQPVPIDGSSWYTFSAYLYANDPEVEGAFLRVSWYASLDASGSALSSVDSSEELTDAQDVFRQLTTTSVQAPEHAQSANVRIVVRPRSASAATVFVDDAWFVASDPNPVNGATAESPTDGPVDADGPITRPRSPNSSAARGATSQVEASVREALPPQPSPVIRRSLAPAADAASESATPAAWLWAVPLALALGIPGGIWIAVRARRP